MARQIRAATGNQRIRRNQVAELEGRLGILPQLTQLKQEKELAERGLALEEQRFAHDERRFAQERRQAKKQLRAISGTCINS